MTVRYFLNQVDVESWELFHRERPEEASWGFTEGHESRARSEIREGHRLACWLLGRRAWCGVLEVVGGMLLPDDPRTKLDRRFPKRDGSYPVRFPVRALVALPAEQAVDAFDPNVLPVLGLPPGVEPGLPGWNARLRRDLADIGAEHGALLLQSLSAKAEDVPLAYDADTETYNPDDALGSPERVTREILARRGQGPFRNALLRAYGQRCAITGCGVVDVLEAAHIIPVSGMGVNRASNGLLLRADLHVLFDCGLLKVEPDTLRVVISECLKASEYACLHGKQIRLPEAESDAPCNEALRRRARKL